MVAAHAGICLNGKKAACTVTVKENDDALLLNALSAVCPPNALRKYR